VLEANLHRVTIPVLDTAAHRRRVATTAIPAPVGPWHVAAGRHLRTAEGGSALMSDVTGSSASSVTRRTVIGAATAIAAALGLGGRLGARAA